MNKFFLCLFLFPLSLFALEIQRDSKDSFIFADRVLSLGEQKCQNGILFMPENSSYFGEASAPGIPFRTYIIALPNSTPPSVEIETLKSEALGGKPCGAGQSSLKIGEPYLKDNLWVVKVNVPLIYSTGNSWSARRSFKVKISFSGGANNFSVGKRALALVENKKAASRFGAKQSAPSQKLKKPDDGIDWLIKIGVGSSDLSVNADGMYAVSFDDLKKAMRAAGRENDIDGINISQLRLFGASPDTLPEAMADETFPGMREIPIQVKDNNDSKIFDSGDLIMFFGYGTAIWKQSGSNSGMDYYFSHSPYSYYQYFYLGAGGTGERLASKKNGSGEKDITWKKYARSEKDLILRDNYFSDNVEENTGKEWFWFWGNTNATVAVNSSEFQNSVKNLNGIQGNSIYIGVSFFPRRSTSGDSKFSGKEWKEKMKDINFNLYFQNEKMNNADIKDTIPGGSFVFASNKAKTSGNEYKLEILSKGKNDRFDGLSIAYEYDPSKSAGDEWLFPGLETGKVKIPVPSGMEIIKTNKFIPTEIIEAENGFASDAIGANEDTRYFLHKKDSYKTPASIEGIARRISAVSNPIDIPAGTEYLIITSESLQEPARKLKQFREDESAPMALKTAVVLAEDIYRYHGEHGSPVAIRDFLRYAAKRSQDLRFVLLAGNGHYDYRNIRRSSIKANLIPPYEAEDTSTDDFFAILAAGEAVRFGDYYLNLAVGRLPVLNAAEFENYVQKAIEYEKISAMNNGIWRNTLIFNADDDMQGTQEDRINHTRDMENTAKAIDKLSLAENSFVEMRKISLLQYDKNGSGKKPEATKELLLRMNQGALFTFFYGHGNTVMWADENLLNVGSISEVSNAGRYTILGSFSCQVARFDDAATVGLSEAFVTAKSKGAIAAIGSLRESLATYNRNLSEKILTESLFEQNTTIGEAFLRAKRSAGLSHSDERYNNEKYALLGEPVLSIPRQNLSIKLDNAPDTIQALEKLKISGEVSAQTGFVRMQILESDKQKTLSHLGTVVPVKVQGSPIYNEELKIAGGKFSTEFVTSRKLSLGDSAAQIRLWAYEPGKAGVGKNTIGNIMLYGTSPYADSIKGSTPPSIKIYPCMRSGIAAPFEENARVSLEVPACLNVVIEHPIGLDYREEADEGVFFEVSGSPPWHPWQFDVQTGRLAEARMNFGSSYEPGEYVFKVHAQDILGNVAVRSMKISLTNDSREGLADVFNMPNPMKRNGTTFYFKDLSGERQSSVRIKIFDQNGKLVKTINNAISGMTSWDGRDSRGRLLANGLYHYIVQNTVSSLEENGRKKTFEKKQKLVISR